MELTAGVVRDIADMGKQHGVRFQRGDCMVAYSLAVAELDLIDMVGRDNVEVVIDFWHLWAVKTAEDVEAAQGFHLQRSLRDGVRPPKKLRRRNGTKPSQAISRRGRNPVRGGSTRSSPRIRRRLVQ